MPIIEYIRYSVDANQAESFIDAYAKAADPLGRSEFCLGYELSQCAEEPGKFILRIDWTSAEDHPAKFRSSTEFREFFSYIRPYLKNIDEMRHYNATTVASL